MKYQLAPMFDVFEKDLYQQLDNLLSFESSCASGKGHIPCDLIETEQNYLLFMELPGMIKEDISLEVKENHLHIQGERKIEQEKGKRLMSERSFGKFSRVLSLDPQSKPEQIEANFEQGILKIVIPKGEAHQVKKISIN